MRSGATTFLLTGSMTAALLLSACGGSSSRGGPPVPRTTPPSALATDLTVIVRPGFIANASPTTYRLTCQPSGGTVPRPTEACAGLPGVAALLAPRSSCVAADTGTEEIVGAYRGRRVDVRFGGCRADRRAWARLAGLFGISA